MNSESGSCGAPGGVEAAHAFNKGRQAMADEAMTDFFVTCKLGGSAGPHWLVYRRSLNACVDAASDAAAAIEKAVKMANFCVLGGQSSQVHVRERDGAPWRTVWYPSHELRRFP